jgi:very-short-patch-repair endonuclease
MGYHRWRSAAKTWKVTKDIAKSMRRKPTKAEALLWKRLRDGQLEGAKFRRQHGIGSFLVDFCCPEAMVVVEVDGAIHDEPEAQERDAEKDAYLISEGFCVLRIRNEEVSGRPENVIAVIVAKLGGAKAR